MGIQRHQANAIIKKIFGDKHAPLGHARHFRKSINQWAKGRFGSDSVESAIVYVAITGHKPSGQVKKTYEASVDKTTLPKEVNRIIKEYVKDIRGKHTSGKNKGKYINNKDYGKGFEGYSVFELRKGFKNLEKLLETKKDNVIEYDVVEKYQEKGVKKTRIVKEKVTLDNMTLETMVDYFLKTGPRVNEVAIDKTTFNIIKRDNTQFQLE